MYHSIEDESGTYTATQLRRHNGYFAGDFSAAPVRVPDFRMLLSLNRLAGSPTAR
jgi:hypothetical protein